MNLQKYLNKFSNYEEFTKSLEDTKIKIKEHNNFPSLALLYIPFKQITNGLTEIERCCRSVIINKNDLKIISYSYPIILYNDYVSLTNCEIMKDKRYITECIEGTILTMYYYENKWMLSTRKCIDASKSCWRKNKSHFDLFKESIEIDWDTFCDVHDTNYIYTYILVHHKNIQLIDYTKKYGENYKKVILSLIRNKDTFEVTLDNLFSKYKEIKPFMEKFIISKELDDYSHLDDINIEDESIDMVNKIKDEGLLVSFISEDNTETYIKLHNNAYKIYQETSNYNYIPMSSQHYISLYQTNMLDNYLNKFVGESLYMVDNTQYQIKGLIDNIFKLLTTELLFLFKFFWDIKFGTQIMENKNIYIELPTEYKKFFYILRGIYFKKKLLLNENKYITVKVVYDLLKESSPDTIINLIQERKNYLLNKSMKIYNVLTEYHKNENVVKLLTNMNTAVDFCLSKKATL